MTVEWLLFVVLIVSVVLVLAAMAGMVAVTRACIESRNEHGRTLADLLAQFAYQLCVPGDAQTELAQTMEHESDGKPFRHKAYRPKPAYGPVDRPMSGTEPDIDSED